MPLHLSTNNIEICTQCSVLRDYGRHLITVVMRNAVKCVHHLSCSSVCLPCCCELNTHLSIPHPSCCIAKQVTMLILYHGNIALQQIYDKSVYLRISGYDLFYHISSKYINRAFLLICPNPFPEFLRVEVKPT